MKRHALMTPAQRNAALAAKRKAAANRLHVTGLRIFEAVKLDYLGASVTIGETTSNAPLIRLALPDGDVFHITVTKARK